MLVELGLVEQRHKAVLEVFDGATVTDVAPPLWGVTPDGPHLAAPLRERGPVRAG